MIDIEALAIRNGGPFNLVGAPAKIKYVTGALTTQARVLLFKGIQDIFRCIDMMCFMHDCSQNMK